jgi:uncharacterized phage protein (TIGR01671 family)
MSEFKFRFWHKSTKIMIGEIEVRENINDFFEYENLEALLFLGEIDNQGFEIYAGDIVKDHNEWEPEDDFILYEIRFCVAGYSSTMGFHAFNMKGELYNFYGGIPDIDTLTVIGNIYANPELIGGANE